uniref:C2H2-type domain-containing protein n=1 Tax=Macrostomum lignano TaxID=282301 RepID=A0A1I8H0J1_9PLAT
MSSLPKRPGLVWQVGEFLEAQDAWGNWTAAKLLAVHEDTKSVLVHYHKWSAKFDEEIEMSSERLRPLNKPTKQSAESAEAAAFQPGDLVLARWRDTLWYQAKVISVDSKGHYSLFFTLDSWKAKGYRASQLKPYDAAEAEAIFAAQWPATGPSEINYDPMVRRIQENSRRRRLEKRGGGVGGGGGGAPQSPPPPSPTPPQEAPEPKQGRLPPLKMTLKIPTNLLLKEEKEAEEAAAAAAIKPEKQQSEYSLTFEECQEDASVSPKQLPDQLSRKRPADSPPAELPASEEASTLPKPSAVEPEHEPLAKRARLDPELEQNSFSSDQNLSTPSLDRSASVCSPAAPTSAAAVAAAATATSTPGSSAWTADRRRSFFGSGGLGRSNSSATSVGSGSGKRKTSTEPTVPAHWTIETFECDQCGKSFRKEKLLSDHIRFYHRPKGSGRAASSSKAAAAGDNASSSRRSEAATAEDLESLMSSNDMIQCEVCRAFQHARCASKAVDLRSIPDLYYVCSFCLHPRKEFKSTRRVWHHKWLRQPSSGAQTSPMMDVVRQVMELYAIVQKLKRFNTDIHSRLIKLAPDLAEKSPDEIRQLLQLHSQRQQQQQQQRSRWRHQLRQRLQQRPVQAAAPSQAEPVWTLSASWRTSCPAWSWTSSRVCWVAAA